MDKLIPKNFILWRPKALLLLIFLEVVFARTGSEMGFENTNIYNGRRGYKQPCEGNWDCQHQFVCDPFDAICTCNNRLSNRLNMYYNEELGSCVSVVGKVCTMKAEEKEELHPIGCVPNAKCVRKPGFRLSTTLGTCECLPSFEESVEHLCEPVKIMQFSDGSPIFAMPERRVETLDGGPLPPVQIPEQTTKKTIDIPASFHRHYQKQDDLHSGSGSPSNSSFFSAQTRILSDSSIFNTLVIITLHLVLWR